MQKITYASLGSLGEDFHQAFDHALKHVQEKLGRTYPLYVKGLQKKAHDGVFDDVCPFDRRRVLGKFQRANREETRQAIAAAKGAFSEWRELGWPQRISFLRKAAELMTERQFRLAALLSLEVGKNRFEAIAEVSESIDLINYYCDQMQRNHGYEMPLSSSATEKTKSVLKPYGVWAVISPFNFPLALATGMAAGAMVAGNTVVFKAASDTPWSGFALNEMMRDAGLPIGVFNFLTGSGAEIGEEFTTNEDVDGLIFTGSRPVGTRILQSFCGGRYPRPCIAEMGGKNPAIVMPSADLEDATEGVLRSAFGMGGQKCSACSRAYVHKSIYNKFVTLLIEKTQKRKVGDPLQRDTFLGPLINENAVQTFQKAVRLGQREGRVVLGGHRLTKGDFVHGYYVEPTIIDNLPRQSRIFQDEFFVPVLALAEIKSLEEAIELANSTDYGLTAGLFSNSESEHDYFFDCIRAGVTYVNRAGGATTGAWPGVQSFGGWKASGSSGKSALGPYYVAQFLREQSQTVMKKPAENPLPPQATRRPAMAIA
jgi:1-pyrroline-5-carboxylate dehydrogenase